jgi:Arc/MetJ-type ribon-helix-helix transcriptional regulator
MTIHLPEPLESSIRAAVHNGRFASLDDAMAEAARLLLREIEEKDVAVSRKPAADQGFHAQTSKPIWEEILELTADVPDAEWERLPPDLAEQHDHHIYGTPKRPTA